MYSIGEKVINNNGVACIIKDITTLDMAGIDKTRLYYILSSILSNANTYYIPTDNESSLRYVMTENEAKAFVDNIDSIEPMSVADDKTRETQYREVLKSCAPEKWASLIKTLRRVKEKRLSEGKRFTSLDDKYLTKAENSLFGELQVALDMPKNVIEELLSNH